MASLDIILEKYEGEPMSSARKAELAERKNEYYRELLTTLTEDDVSTEVRNTLAELKKRGIRIAIGSSSKNAKFILEQVGLIDEFDAISDGTNITHSKPDPEVFLKAAEFLGADPSQCMVVEDAEAGIDAAIAGDQLAKEIFDYTGTILGEALADFMAFSSPEAIVLFGGLAHAGKFIFDPIQKSLDEHVLPIFKGKAKLLMSELKDADAAVLGASALGWEI